MLSKLGFTALDVWNMSHLVASAWIESLLESQGVKSFGQTGGQDAEPTTIISMRKPRNVQS